MSAFHPLRTLDCRVSFRETWEAALAQRAYGILLLVAGALLLSTVLFEVPYSDAITLGCFLVLGASGLYEVTRR